MQQFEHRTSNVQRRTLNVEGARAAQAPRVALSFIIWQNALFDIQRSMFDVRRSSFICSQGVDSLLKYVEFEFTPGQEP